MRVLFIARYLQMVNHRKVQALSGQPGVELTHIAPRRWRDGLCTYVQELRDGQGYRFIAARTLFKDDIHRFIYWPPGLYLRRVRPDIIHLEEEPDSLAALQAVLARRLCWPAARLILFTWQNIRRPRNRAVELLARFVLRRADHVIAGNREAVGVLRDQGYAGPVTVLPQLGVDTTVFRPAESPDQSARQPFRRLSLSKSTSTSSDDAPPGSFVVGYVGRFVPEKGLDTLVRAAALLPNSFLLLVGRGPAQAGLEALAAKLGLGGRLQTMPPVAHDEVPRCLHLLDAFVLPSRTTRNWKEQFGHVLIEAMACGVPVVGSSSGAIPDVIDDAGLVFPEGDVEALAAHLRMLAERPDERLRLREAGLQRVRSHYTHEKIAQETLSVYESVARNDARIQA